MTLRLSPPTAAPTAPVRPVTVTVHGRAVTDPYAWLKAENWKDVLKDPSALPAEIRDLLVAENAYAEAALAGTTALRETLVAEMRGRIREDDGSVPDLDGPFAYYTRYREGGQHPLVCRRPADRVAPGLVGDLAGEGEEILIDGDREGEGHAFFSLEDATHSDDHRLVAWSADTKGSELYTIRVRDLATGQDLEDRVLATTGDVVWSGDAAPSGTSPSTRTTAPRPCGCTASARRRATTRRSTRRAIPASSSASARPSPAPTWW